MGTAKDPVGLGPPFAANKPQDGSVHYIQVSKCGGEHLLVGGDGDRDAPVSRAKLVSFRADHGPDMMRRGTGYV
jgi:hypothetical protein